MTKFKHTSKDIIIVFGLCLVGGAKEENWKEPEDNFTAEQWEALKKRIRKLIRKIS